MRDTVAVATSRLIMEASSRIWGTCSIRDFGDWASGTGFPLVYQGHSDLQYLLCKVGDMNRQGNEVYITATSNTIDDAIARKIHAKIHPLGTVIFPKIGGAIATNKRRILSKKSAIDNNVLGIIPNKLTDSKWLYYFLRTIDLSEYQSGTSVPALRQSIIGEISAPLLPVNVQVAIARFLTWQENKERNTSWDEAPPLPPQLEEQRPIVARIEELAARVEEAGKLRSELGASLSALCQSASEAAFTVLEGTKIVSVQEVSIRVTKGTTPKTYGHPFVDSGIPFLRAEEVKDGLVAWQDARYFLSSVTNDFMNRSKTRPGDVLVTIAGVIGRSAVVPSDAPELNMNQAVALIRPTAEIDPLYLSHFIRSPQGRSQLRGKTVATAMSNISLGTVKTLQVPLPLIDEQHRIVIYLDNLQSQVDSLNRLQVETAADLNALLPSIFDKALKGEL